MRFRRSACATLCLSLAGAVSVFAQTKPADKKDAPQVRLASPLGIVPGQPTVVTIRGLKLDTTTAIRFPDSPGAVKAEIKSAGKAALPPRFEAPSVGDTQVEAELTLPGDLPARPIPFVLVTPTGDCEPHRLIVLESKTTSPEREPNDGFNQAQEIQTGTTVVGSLHQPQNVDMFKFAGTSGQKITIEVLAARYGSGLDAVLTVYDSRGQILAIADDRNEDTDAVLETVLPAAGTYFVALTDAHDRGGPTSPYLLRIR